MKDDETGTVLTAPVEQDPAPADESTPEAPFGYMKDPATGEMRPRKRPGRRPKHITPPAGPSPALEDLQALGTLSEASEDTAPGAPSKRRPRKSEASIKAELPPFRAGVIAKGMNQLYRRAGKIIRIWDDDLGVAVISCTYADEDDPEATVGDAWENLAKQNPRIRAFLLKMMVRGAYARMFTAHLPIFMAIAMKESVRSRIPLLDLASAFLTDDTPEGPAPSDLSESMGGIGPQDMAQMMQMAQATMAQMMGDVPRPANSPRAPDTFAGVREHPADQG